MFGTEPILGRAVEYCKQVSTYRALFLKKLTQIIIINDKYMAHMAS